MNLPSTISRWAALLLLLLFVLSIAPKQFLHHCFADHTDRVLHTTGHEGAVNLHTDGFYCDCNHQVASAPFMADMLYMEVPSIGPYSIRQSHFLLNNILAEQLPTGLRGPPAIA